jgi:hypothetical protein
MAAISELERALEEYLPVVLGLTAKGLNFYSLSLLCNFQDYAIDSTQLLLLLLESRLEASVQFSWRTLDDDQVIKSL